MKTPLELTNTFTSTGAKFFAHQEVMTKLRNGQGQPVVTHVMLTDVCNHTCAFCSVQARAGDSLNYNHVMGYLDILQQYGLKAVILSGGGNPILYHCKVTKKKFDHVVKAIHSRGLEIGLITNGIRLERYQQDSSCAMRWSWKGVAPETLDRLTWVRISMAGMDHKEDCVYVPDIDPEKTTLGFSYVAHDIYDEPEDPHHGKVSRPLDLISGNRNRAPNLFFEERIDKLTEQITYYVKKYKPAYVRLLPNCLEPDLISHRCKQLQAMADVINFATNRDVAFVQHKPPRAPNVCLLGYIHPVLNCDGYIYPCDSCVLNEAAEHQFANPWRVCRWDEVGQLYEKPVRSLIDNPAERCPGCVFHGSNDILEDVRDGLIDTTPPAQTPVHVNFV